MVDPANNPDGQLLTTAALTLEEAPPAQWLRISSRAPAGRIAQVFTRGLGGEPGPAVNTVRRIPGGPDILADGAGCWLLRYPAEASLPAELPRCALTDISDSLVGLRARGDLALQLVATGCPLDLGAPDTVHPNCARSMFHHIPLLLHQFDAQTVDLFVPRSYLSDFRHALQTAARQLVDLHTR